MHIFHEIQGVQKCGETLSEMFDMFFSIKAKTQGEKRETKLQKSMLIMRSGIQTPSTEGRDFHCLIENVGNEGCASCAGKRKGVPK